MQHRVRPMQTDLASVILEDRVRDRFFALSGQCLPCSAQTAKAVYGANLIFTISMTIAMVLLPEILVSFWCGCNIRLAGLGHALGCSSQGLGLAGTKCS
jgi:hypothetical protein